MAEPPDRMSQFVLALLAILGAVLAAVGWCYFFSQ
jgi:hypothetical protein